MLITNLNHDQSLLTRLESLVAEREEMRVLVGFFHFWVNFACARRKIQVICDFFHPALALK